MTDVIAWADSDLVGVSEIARRQGTSPGTIRSWRRRHADFPEPTILEMGPVWRWGEVAPWLARRGRRS